ncbi:hypothetical protein THAOC_10530 [Thalassiosira oceanica]|uniref:Uncharacterized protein n=1 Tax=Thalassiosira oceanica TaxID=159749 RepID=K0SPT2_THAOC|nr:hypothetical protein THAOC_10530 [Thalassiosira oceanica]|eukprot:EJK68303.1 hypothetical protein THAOC_10530 [Thalassiosira oceanica]
MLRRLGLGRSTVVDAAEAGENTPAGSLAENPGETERSAAEFGGAPRDRDRNAAASAATASAARDEPSGSSAEGDYEEETHEMTRWFQAEAAALAARTPGARTPAARTPGARRQPASAAAAAVDSSRLRRDYHLDEDNREAETMRTAGVLQREDRARAGAATRRASTSQVSLQEPLEGPDDPSDGADRRPPPPHSFDESLNVSRIGQHRAHHDADTEGSWSLPEGEENDDLDIRARRRVANGERWQMRLCLLRSMAPRQSNGPPAERSWLRSEDSAAYYSIPADPIGGCR